MNKEEIALIHLAQNGDTSAFEKLVMRYDKAIMDLICRMLNDEEDAKDVYQDVFLKVYKKIESFNFKSEFYTWLYRIAVNSCINFRKKRKKKWEFENNSAEYLCYENKPEMILMESTPEKELLNLELSQKLIKGMENLSPKQKTVFILRHYQGLKLSEIAKILNTKEGTVKNYLFRAMEKMRKELKSYQSG